ncbi:MAG TPA: Na+/H+ antiporter NhaA, partial [Trebonia sp.]|nr:Na+/H+ antiporter NhaA [Trebonia sp.]
MTEPQQASPAEPGPVPAGQGGTGQTSTGQASPGQASPGQASTGQASTGQASTAWTSSGKTPLRQFLRTETGSATMLGTATLAALIWSNAASGSYGTFWATQLSVRVAGHGIAMDLRQFVNSALMALFFLVVGLEARREWDMGELRVRTRVALPFLAGLGGMVVPIAIYLAFNAGKPSAHGWGAAMSSDTAFALGALALAGGRGLPDRVRTYLLTFSVVDDLLGLAVIAVFYSSHVRWLPLLIGAVLLAADGALTARGMRTGPAYLLIGLGAWVAFWESGVDPIVAGLVIGLLTNAYPAARADLQQATDAFRLFREQPTARLAAEAREEVRSAISPNERLQERYHGMTSYVIVPLFALANADIRISGSFLAHAYSSPATLGIMIGYLAGKPAGTAGTAWLVSRVTKRKLTPPVGWGAVAGAGAVAGIGFTVALLVSSLAFTGTQLAQAKLGILSGAVCATLLTWIVFRGIGLLPVRPRLRALLGTAGTLTDLAVPVQPDRDHVRGPRQDALVTLVEYGDFECPFCREAHGTLKQLLMMGDEIGYAYRHFPLTQIHPHAQQAAAAAEAAGEQGRFWEMHDLLFEHQDALRKADLLRYADDLGLDVERFTDDLRRHVGRARVDSDVDSADLSGVSGTPTFFVNGRRHHGAYDIESLKAA